MPKQKDKNSNRKNSFIDVLKELGAGLILALLAIVACLVGFGLLSLLPENCTDDLGGGFALFLGCLALFATLSIIYAIVHLIKKRKAKHTKTEHSNDTENSPQK